MERRREMEQRYEDAQEGPGAVAGGGEDWAEANGNANEGDQSRKRGRSPDDDGDADGNRSSQRMRPEEPDVEAERM